MKKWTLFAIALIFLACEKQSDQPPLADFTINFLTGDTYTLFEVDASLSSDPDGPDSLMKYKWDWESDGIYDLLFDYNPRASHRFSKAGIYSITVQVIDLQGLTHSAQKEISVSRGSIAPLDPFSPSPSDSSNNIIFAGHLSWVAIDPDDDPMTYDVYLGDDSNPVLWKSGLTEPRVTAPDLVPGKKYFWKVVITDETGNVTTGPVWKFSIHSGTYERDSIRDPRDGQTYKTIKIGSYWWMAENLNFNREGVSKCRNDLEENCEKYGRYYYVNTRDTTICPPGWRGPDTGVIYDLETALGMSEDDIRKFGVWRGKDQGMQLAPNGTSGLNLSYDGYLDSDGKWKDIGEVRLFGNNRNYLWPSRMIQKGYGGILNTSFPEVEYVPVRCVKGY